MIIPMEQEYLLSLILPAYNEEKRLPECMEKAAGFVASHSEPIEVILVENGSSDRTYEMGLEYAKQYPWLKVIHEEKAGKGSAVRRGMLEAKGRYRMFADVDFSMPISEVDHFIPPVLSDYAVAIGSREVPGARRYNEPPRRHFAERLFRAQKIDGWAFDAEVLFLAQHFGYEIIEVPVQWYYDGNSKINVIRDSFRMLKELLQIRVNYFRGAYK